MTGLDFDPVETRTMGVWRCMCCPKTYLAPMGGPPPMGLMCQAGSNDDPSWCNIEPFPDEYVEVAVK